MKSFILGNGENKDDESNSFNFLFVSTKKFFLFARLKYIISIQLEITSNITLSIWEFSSLIIHFVGFA